MFRLIVSTVVNSNEAHAHFILFSSMVGIQHIEMKIDIFDIHNQVI